mmetsp:Transcript_114271/g.227389  ORF Transcript_114271/g.227389 Transcript_114271/m.227389 type:complete len:213 (-) Transcript_114271:577-1215(-)
MPTGPADWAPRLPQVPSDRLFQALGPLLPQPLPLVAAGPHRPVRCCCWCCNSNNCCCCCCCCCCSCWWSTPALPSRRSVSSPLLRLGLSSCRSLRRSSMLAARLRTWFRRRSKRSVRTLLISCLLRASLCLPSSLSCWIVLTMWFPLLAQPPRPPSCAPPLLRWGRRNAGTSCLLRSRKSVSLSASPLSFGPMYERAQPTCPTRPVRPMRCV